MNKEDLIKLGLTEEQAEGVLKALDGNFVTKTRFNEVNAELSQAKGTIKERDGQLEELKGATGDVETLKGTISELQAANTAQAEAHAAEIKQLRLDSALGAALSAAKAKNPETVKPLLKAFLDKAELDETGNIKGLGDEIKKLADAEDSKFLFEAETKQKPSFTGLTPRDGADKSQSEAPKTLADAIQAHYSSNER